MVGRSRRPTPEGSLSITALYTSQAWVFGGFEYAGLLATSDAKRAFDVTNFVLKVARFFKPGPVLACSLAQRHAMFDRVVRDSGATHVVEIAAGLSQRGAVFSKDPGLRYVEIDLPGMVEKKRQLLSRSNAGREILMRPNFILCSADVRDDDLSDYVEPARRACVVAEGLFMYLTAGQQRDLWRRVVQALRHAGAGVFVFDLTPSVEEWRSGFAGRVLDWLLKRATGGSTFVRDDRGRHDIASELRDAGFDSVEFLEPGPLLDAWKLPFPQERTQVLLFRCEIAISS